MATFNISLADLRQDIAGVIPPELVLDWNARDKSEERHRGILAPFQVRGTIVSSDSAGLSKLTQRYSLPQVMKLVSEPKEVIHAYGKAIGGEAVGVWAADNTQMFYPESISPGQVVTQMLAAQRRIRGLTVQVGMGVHVGACYSVGGGLYGHDADHIEDIAEEHTRGGEVLLSDRVYPHLAEGVRAASRLREDLQPRGTFYSLCDYQEALAAIEGSDGNYPTPFDGQFLKLLRDRGLDDLATASFDDYQANKVVVFLKVGHHPHPFLLDSFTDLSLIDLSVRRVADSYQADVVKSTGALAIVLFDSAAQAVAFARDVIETNRRLGFDARVGVTRGEVYLFPLDRGGKDIAGNPVNIASKLSEDSGLTGILVEGSIAASELDPAVATEPFKLVISRIELTGQRIAV